MKPFCHHIICYFTVEVEERPPVGKKSRTVFPNRWRYGKGTVGCRSCSPWDISLAVAMEGPWMGWNGLWRSGGNLVANLSKFWQLLFIWQVFEALPNESSALWTREDVHFSSHLCSGQVFLIETVCDWSCPSVDSWPIFKCSPFLFRNKTTEICVSHCREIVWKSHPYYSHMGSFWANKGSSRICIQYWAPKTLVSCPTRWFLLSTFGYLWWSSSWWWQPHIARCKLFCPLWRAGMTVLRQFFC